MTATRVATSQGSFLVQEATRIQNSHYQECVFGTHGCLDRLQSYHCPCECQHFQAKPRDLQRIKPFVPCRTSNITLTLFPYMINKLTCSRKWPPDLLTNERSRRYRPCKILLCTCFTFITPRGRSFSDLDSAAGTT